MQPAPTPSQTNAAPPATSGGGPPIAPRPGRIFIPYTKCSKPGAGPSDNPEIQRIVFGDPNLCGFPMAHLLTCSAEELREKIPDFDNQTILEILLVHIEIKIHWPGYSFLDFSRKIYLSERGAGGVSCKGELAIEVAKAYNAFLKQAACTIPVGCHPSLIIAPNGPFDIKNLALAALNNVYDGVFQADVELMCRPIIPCVTGRMLLPAQGVRRPPVVVPGVTVPRGIGPQLRPGVRYQQQMPPPTPCPTVTTLVNAQGNWSGVVYGHPVLLSQGQQVTAARNGVTTYLKPAQW